MQRTAARTAWQPPLQPLQPGERLRLLGELATPVGSLAEMAYAPGWCEGRHSHRNASFIYVVGGDHWATHSRGGDTVRAGTVRYLPAGEPHEVYFPLGSICLQLELESSIIALAAEQGHPLECPGEIHDARARLLGARLHHELFTSDDLSRLEVEGVALQLLLAGEPAGRVQRRDALRAKAAGLSDSHGRGCNTSGGAIAWAATASAVNGRVSQSFFEYISVWSA